MSDKLQNTADNTEIPVQIVDPHRASKNYQYIYHSPNPAVIQLIDSHWSMHWDLGVNNSFTIELASSPYIAFIFTQFGNFVTGIHTGTQLVTKARYMELS